MLFSGEFWGFLMFHCFWNLGFGNIKLKVFVFCRGFFFFFLNLCVGLCCSLW